MTHLLPGSQALLPDVSRVVTLLGERIRIARKRRAMTIQELASRMFVTRKTVSRLEKGDPGVSLGVFASALWVLGLDKSLLEVAVPERDEVGLFRERQRLPLRIRPSANPDDDPDF